MQQNRWAGPRLQPYAHSHICLDFKVAQVMLTVLSNGELTIAGEIGTAEATIHLPPSLVMRLLRQDPQAHSLIKIEGNSALGMEIGKIMAAIRWDVEEDLSIVVGDLAAFEVVKLSQQTMQHLHTKAKNLGDMLVEYWQEEQPLLAKKNHIAQFNQAVDQLREDIDRLQQRVEKLLAANTTAESQP